MHIVALVQVLVLRSGVGVGSDLYILLEIVGIQITVLISRSPCMIVRDWSGIRFP